MMGETDIRMMLSGKVRLEGDMAKNKTNFTVILYASYINNANTFKKKR